MNYGSGARQRHFMSSFGLSFITGESDATFFVRLGVDTPRAGRQERRARNQQGSSPWILSPFSRFSFSPVSSAISSSGIRNGVGEGKSVSVRVNLGGGRYIKKKK